MNALVAWCREWARRLATIGPGAVANDAPLNEEMRAHLEMEAEALVRTGLTPAEAMRRARLHAGGLADAVEAVRDQRGIPLVERTTRAVAHAWRSLRAHPAYSAAVVLSLGLGLGVTTAITGIADALFREPLPYTHASELVVIGEVSVSPRLKDRTPDTSWAYFSSAEMAAWRARSHTLTALTRYQELATTIETPLGAEFLPGAGGSTNLLEVLGASVAMGRWFGPDESRAKVVVLSDALWRRAFGADSAVVGHTVRLYDAPMTVIGVMPPGNNLVPNAQFWIPLNDDDEAAMLIGRPRPGVEFAQITRELEQLSPGVANLRHAHYQVSLLVRSLEDQRTGAAHGPVQLLSAAAVLLLLIAAANVAGLSLARVLERQRELALRTALGASRRALAGLLLAEHLLLALGGAVVAAALAFSTVHVARAVAPEEIRQVAMLRVTSAALAFDAAAAFLLACVIGAGATAVALRVPLARSLAQGSARGGGGRASSRARRALVVAQLALTLVLLIGTGLLVRTVERLTRIDRLGFTPHGVTIASLELTGNRYTTDSARALAMQSIVTHLRTMPGVERVTLGPPPLVGGRGDGFLTEGFSSMYGMGGSTVWIKRVDTAYRSTYGLHLVAGRWFDRADAADTGAVAVLNRSGVKAFFPEGAAGADVVGQTIHVLGLFIPPPNTPTTGGLVLLPTRPTGPPVLVIGVVDDILQRDLAMDASPEILLLDRQPGKTPTPTVAVRASISSRQVAAALAGAIREVDPSLAPRRLESMDAVVSASLARFSFVLLVVGAFAALALTLAAVGLYGMVSYVVARRTPEIAVRMAVGARAAQVYTLVMREGTWLALAGLAIGLPMALSLTRFLRAFLFQVAPDDLGVFWSAPIAIVGVALAATVLPARRAARTDPASTLRAE